MRKRVILTLMEGSFEQGFQVILRIREDGAPADTGIQVIGRLPPAPQLPEAFNNWQSAYRQTVTLGFGRIVPTPGQVTNLSWHDLGSQLVECLNNWLNSASREWQRIRDGLQQNLNHNDEIEVLIQTDDFQLRQLPWHLWNLFSEHYTKAEVALSLPEYEPPPRLSPKISKYNTKAKVTLNSSEYEQSPLRLASTRKLRILAVLGNSTGINVQQDRVEIEQLRVRGAEPNFLVEPQRQVLDYQLREQQWDILFFAGHSCSQVDGSTGQIYINQTDTLSIDDLKYALRTAVRNGLKLAIFNSCDGLGLARELADLHIPQIIVMREPVPDLVAQEFLQHFLRFFASGVSLYLAVREARERLQGLEAQFPYASWLPVICQNPAAGSGTWEELRSSCKHPPFFFWSRLHRALFLSLAVTTAIVGVRQQGFLQPLELQAFDSLQRLRPDEIPDPRLLVVTVTESDIQARKEWPLSDSTLAQLLAKLERYQPRVIGLDIYRDLHIGSGQANLAPHLLNPRLIAVCETSAANKIGIPPPPKIPNDRLGFSDVVVDPDGILRRYLLYMTTDSTSPCTANYAFSLQLAYHYLAAEGIQPQEHPKGYVQIGTTVFKRLTDQTGGYQKLDARGHQVLLNYRSSPSVAEQVTLSDILNDRFDPNLVKNRIVLIGVTAASVHDDFSTPYSAGTWPRQTMPGVLVQAQMVSQVLSAVLDGRPLLWVWSAWGEILWIWGWSLVGGAIAWCLRWRLLLRLGLVAVTLGTLYGICFVLLLQGAWVPLVPSALALVVTGGSVVIGCTAHPRPNDSNRDWYFL
jgi:CHASE2 domain-containing sensor protein